jgi:WD40 repeat protein
LSAYKNKIICGYENGEIKIWDLKTWKYTEIPGHITSVLKMYVSGSVLVTQSQYGTIRMYDLEKKRSLHKLNPGSGFSLIGVTAGMVITASESQFKIWDYR